MKTSVLAAGLTLTLLLPAFAETPTIRSVRHTVGGTQITIKGPATTRQSTGAASFREYDLAAPALSAVPPAPAPAVRPAPAPVQAAVPQVTMYTQKYSPGPNTGMARNGFWTPGGASILSSGPIWGGGYWGGGYGFAGGLYGSGYGYPGGYGYPYQGFAGNGFGYTPYYINGNMINTPIQRFNPPPGVHPNSLNPVIPQSFYPGGYGPGYGFPAGGGFRGGGGGGYRGGGGRCGR